MSTRRLIACSGIVAALAIPMAAAPASAAKKQSFCTVVASLGQSISSNTQTFGSEAKRLSKSFKSAAKKVDAPKKVVKAMNDLGSFYDDASKAKNVTDFVAIAAQAGQKYANASATFSQHFLQECLTQTTTTTRPSSASGSSTTAGGSATTAAGSSTGVVAGAFNGGPATVQVTPCTVGGASGSLRSADGAFQLTWSGGTYTLTWRVGSTTYNGPVTAQQAANTLAFTGSAGGVTVQAAVACT